MHSQKIHIQRGNQVNGPYTLEEVQQYLSTGQLSPQDWAMQQGGQWVPLAQISPVHAQISQPHTQPVIQQPQKPALWNPEVTVNLSVFFSTFFGSYLQAKNWESLGQPEKAKRSMRWFYFGIVGNCAGIIWLFFWYYSSGKEQVEYVKERWGDDYTRKGWTKPVLIALSPVLIFTIFLILLIITGA